MEITKQATGVLLQSIIDQGNKTIADVNTSVTNGTNTLEVFKDLKIKELRDENPKLISEAKFEISETTKAMVASVNKEGALQLEAIKAVGVDAVIATGKQEISKIIAEGDKQVNRVSVVIDTKQDKVDNRLTTASKDVVEAINEVNAELNTKLDKGTFVGTANDLWSNENCPIQKTGTGYQKLKSGLIIQWGRTTLDVPVNYNSEKTVTFPISFTSGEGVAVFTELNDAFNPQVINTNHSLVTTTTFTLRVVREGGPSEVYKAPVQWIAIGY